MPGYKRYLYSNASIPRSTLYRVKRQVLKAKLQPRLGAVQQTYFHSDSASVAESTQSILQSISVAGHGAKDNEQPAALPVVASPVLGQEIPVPIINNDNPHQDNDAGNTSESCPNQSTEHSGFPDGVPLCPCTNVTAGDVVLMCLSLCMRHNWTWVALIDTLKMTRTIFPRAESLPKSSYALFQKVHADDLDLSFEVFCLDCDKYIKPIDTMRKFEQCDNCGRNINVSTASNYFCSLPLASQFKKLLEGPGDIGSLILNFRSGRQKQQVNALEDIYDGSVYQQHSKPGGILSFPQNFSYNFFTDGVPMGHSNKTIWPIYVSINELPHKIRGKCILLAGIYVGPKDPNLNMFLKPFVDDANKLSEDGFEWKYNGNKIVSRVIPMCCIADSVARCKILNMQTFHAFWGCTFCYHVQERTSRRLKFTIRPNKKVQHRTKESTLSDVEHAFHRRGEIKEEDRHFRGVKGPSSLATLNYFDTSCGVVVDYMHCILLGVIKSHMELLLDSAFKKKCWILSSDDTAMSDIIGAVDCRLLSIRPPKSVTRAPESLAKRKHWKASQWRSWLLFYCIVCLQDFLKEKYLIHLAMLSKATSIILQKSITLDDVQVAHNLFLVYQFQFQTLFGKEYMFYNIHLLTHVCSGILRYGPAWTLNAFVFEGHNRHLLQLYKSPFRVAFQISKRYLVFKSFPDACLNLATTELTLDFCEEILERHLKYFVRSSNALLLGKGTSCSLSEAELQCFHASSKVSQGLLSYNRILFGGYRVSVECPLRTTQNIDCYVLTKGENLVVVKKNLKLACNKIMIIGQRIEREPEPLVCCSSVSVSHVKRIGARCELVCFEPQDICEQSVYMDLGKDEDKYVSSMLYGCYGD